MTTTMQIPETARYHVILDAPNEVVGDYATFADAVEMVGWDELTGVTVYAVWWDRTANVAQMKRVLQIEAREDYEDIER